MTEDVKNTPQQYEEEEIDLLELAQKVWAERMLVLKACGVAVFVGLIIAFITILVICQVLPLIFAIVVKGWRG